MAGVGPMQESERAVFATRPGCDSCWQPTRKTRLSGSTIPTGPPSRSGISRHPTEHVHHAEGAETGMGVGNSDAGVPNTPVPLHLSP